MRGLRRLLGALAHVDLDQLPAEGPHRPGQDRREQLRPRDHQEDDHRRRHRAADDVRLHRELQRSRRGPAGHDPDRLPARRRRHGDGRQGAAGRVLARRDRPQREGL